MQAIIISPAAAPASSHRPVDSTSFGHMSAPCGVVRTELFDTAERNVVSNEHYRLARAVTVDGPARTPAAARGPHCKTAYRRLTSKSGTFGLDMENTTALKR